MSSFDQAADRINAAVQKAEIGSEILSQVANGDEFTEVPTTSGPVPSLKKWQKDNIDLISGGVIARVDKAILSYPDYASASAAAATLPDGQVVDVDSEKKRYRVESGALVFVANLDQLKQDLASSATGKGGALVAFKQSGTGAVQRTALDKLLELAVSAKDFGLAGDSVTNDQAAMDALIYSSHKVIRFPAGVYRAYLNNTVSGRTFIFDEGAIIDGTVHIAVGTGPDTHSVPTITWVDDTRVIGTVTSTVRVGSFYCRRLNIDKIVITEVNPAYANQTAEGGTNGVHFYCGSKDVEVGEIICRSATDGVYALGVDRGPTNNADHLPENVHVGRLIVKNNTQAIISTNSTVNLTIDEVIADSWDTDGAMSLVGDTNLRIGKVKATASPTTPNKDGIYVLNGVSASFGEIEISGATQIGFRTFNCGRVDAGVIRASGNTLDQVRIESPGYIGRIVTSSMGSGKGVLIQGNANGLGVGEITDVGGGGVTVSADDVVIPRIVSKNNTGRFGIELNGADRFSCQYLLSDGNDQGLRMTTITDPTFGALYILNNNFGIIGSSVTGLSYQTVAYSGNVNYDTNITLNTSPGYRGALVRASTAALGDTNATLTVGTSAVSQVCATSLTANRTVTLSRTGAANGDKFRIARTAASGGAFNLTVSGILGLGSVNLATSQWLEVEYLSGWQMTAKGVLT